MLLSGFGVSDLAVESIVETLSEGVIDGFGIQHFLLPLENLHKLLVVH